MGSAVARMILDTPKRVVATQPDGEFDGSLLAWQRPAHPVIRGGRSCSTTGASGPSTTTG